MKRTWTDDALKESVRTSVTKSAVLADLGLSVRIENYRTIDRHILRLGLDVSHFLGRHHGRKVPSSMKQLTGRRFGQLLVESEFGRNERGDVLWKCVCDCGNETIAKTYNLMTGHTRSCGCLSTGPKPLDVVGEKYNRLTIESFVRSDTNRQRFFRCRCDCGNATIVSLASIRSGATKSCGCLKKENDNNRYGERNPSWNASLTSEDREACRDLDGYKEWCIEVKRRDGFRCRLCGNKTSGHLRSHHLNSYNSDKAGRLDILNGVCLCVVCHVFFHKLFGSGNNTKGQFDLFSEWFSKTRRETQHE